MNTPQELQQAVEAYINGDQDSFTTIYELSHRYLYTCVMHVVKDENTALDMLQETYLEISRNITQLSEPERFMSWAAVIANRKCFAYLKKKRDLLLTAGEDEDNYFDTIADDEAFIPESILQDQEKQRLVREIIDNLSDVQRLCLIGFYFNEQKQEEIAEELGIPVNTVKSHLNRARSKVKEAVIDLDKNKGTRLYTLAPFMLLFFRLEAEACQPIPMDPDLMMAERKDAEESKEMEPSGTGILEKGAKTAALSLKTKAILSTVVVALTVGGITMFNSQSQKKEEQETAAEVLYDEMDESTAEEEEVTGQEETELIEESETALAENEGTEPEVTAAEEETVESEEEQIQDKVQKGLAISGKYAAYGRGSNGVITVVDGEGNLGMVTYEDEEVIPIKYQTFSEMPSKEGLSFYGDASGSAVCDKEGSVVFETDKIIRSVNEEVVFTSDGSGNEYITDFAYYKMDGTALYESDPASMDEDARGVAFSEGYAFFYDKALRRIDKEGNIENVAEIYTVQSEQEQPENNTGYSIKVDGMGIGGWILEVPIYPVSQGFYMLRALQIVEDEYGDWILRSADGEQVYHFDVRNLYSKEGLDFMTSDVRWAERTFCVDGLRYANYGTLFCPALIYEDGTSYCYLIDMSKVEKKEASYHEASTILTDEALLFEAELIDINAETYWVFCKDGQWGYIDHEGNIAATYDYAAAFYQGKAVVVEDGNAYVIDETFTKIKDLGPALSAVNFGEVYAIATSEDGKEGYMTLVNE